MVAAAVLALGLHLCRSELAGFVARGEVVVHLAAEGRDEDEVRRLLDYATDQAILAVRKPEAWQQVLESVPELSLELGDLSADEALAVLDRRLQSRHSRTEAGRRRIELEFSSRDRQAALAAVRELATRYRQSLKASTREQSGLLTEEYHSLVQAARDGLDQAKVHLQAAREEHNRLARQAQEDATGSTRGSSAPTPPVSDRWQELRESLSRMRQDRTEKLISRTEQHPLIVDLDAQIREVEDQLRQTPKHIEPSAEPAPANLSVNRHQTAAQVARHEAAVDRRTRQLEAILLRQEEARETQRLLAEVNVLPIAEPAIVSQLGGRFLASRFSLLLLAAILTGMVSGRLAVIARRPQRLRSVEQVEQLLGFPVTAALAFGDRAEAPRLERPWRIVALVTTRSSEITLLCLGVLVLGCLLTRADYSTLLVSDPLAALAEAQQLPRLLLGVRPPV